MPTGYTAAVCDGKQTEFKDFAMSCARAFGALITMRDDPSDAPIPEEFEPSTYNEKRIAEAHAEFRKLSSMTPEQSVVAADADYAEKLASHLKYEAEQQASEDRLDAMISKVETWTPPTAEHVEMKKFMLDQLRISKRGTYRSAAPVKLAGPDWLAAQKEKSQQDIDYHTVEHAKEVERAAGRTAWVAALRTSLRAS